MKRRKPRSPAAQRAAILGTVVLRLRIDGGDNLSVAVDDRFAAFLKRLPKRARHSAINATLEVIDNALRYPPEVERVCSACEVTS